MWHVEKEEDGHKISEKVEISRTPNKGFKNLTHRLWQQVGWTKIETTLAKDVV